MPKQITIIINGAEETFTVPTSLQDVNWSTYVSALSVEDSEVKGTLSALTDIPIEVVESMNESDLEYILTLCSFFWNEEPEVLEIPEQHAKITIDQGTWQQLVDAEQELKRVGDAELPQIAAAQKVISIYTTIDDSEILSDGVNISTLPVPEALGYWVFFLNQFMAWQKRWSDLYNSTPDENEVAADISRIQQFGWFGTIHALAKGDVLKYDELLKKEANVIYTTLLYEKELQEFVERKRKFDSITDNPNAEQ
ncbi:MAG: hypothetical protein ACPGU4_14025 [Flavobacteriales bacterium]